MKYQIQEKETGVVSESVAVNYESTNRPEISHAIATDKIQNHPQDNMSDTPVATWFLNHMVARSHKDFQEGRVYTHEEVKEMLKRG